VAAEALMLARIDDLPQAARTTRSGRQPELLAGPRVPAGAAREALARWEPLRPAHELGRALDLAVDLAGPKDAILFVTDRPLEDAPARVEVAALGVPLDNVAFASARRLPVGERRQDPWYGEPRPRRNRGDGRAGDARREVAAGEHQAGRAHAASSSARRASVRLSLRRDARRRRRDYPLEPPRVVTSRRRSRRQADVPASTGCSWPLPTSAASTTRDVGGS
jgi:hypothetical protein